jgi:hypothetical protein
MTKYQKLAAYFIDLVETVIRDSNPKVEKIGKKCKGGTLLYGDCYYFLEDTIAQKLKTFKGGKK